MSEEDEQEPNSPHIKSLGRRILDSLTGKHTPRSIACSTCSNKMALIDDQYCCEVCGTYLQARKPEMTPQEIRALKLIQAVNRGEMSTDEMFNYELYPDTPEHGALLRKYLKASK